MESPHWDSRAPKYYPQDKKVIDDYLKGIENVDRSICKYAVAFETVGPAEQEMFDNKVVATGNSYEPIETTDYSLYPSETKGTVNCNKGAYNLLKRAGVSEELLNAIGERLPGLTWGWGQNMPWTQEEQELNRH